VAGLVVGTLIVGGGSMIHAVRQDWHNQEFNTLLKQDLIRLGGGLSGHVQCLDMADGCISTLYDMSLVQATGFLYDCYMFPSEGIAIAEASQYRDAFWKAVIRNPPAIFIVTSYDCDNVPQQVSYDYHRIRRWPKFNAYLNENYRLYAQRLPPHMVNWGSSPSKPLGYRIYLKNQSPSSTE
jgi:hypothetical protein